MRFFAFWFDRSLLLFIERPLAWACVVAIAILSLIPGDNRPHTGLPGRGEHFIAYAGAAFLFTPGYRGLHQRILALIGLAIASGDLRGFAELCPGTVCKPTRCSGEHVWRRIRTPAGRNSERDRLAEETGAADHEIAFLVRSASTILRLPIFEL